MSINLQTNIQYIKGVGPGLGELLQKRGIHNVSDLLENYPRSYEDHRVSRSITSLQPNENISLKAYVESVSSINMGRSRKKMYEILLSDSSGKVACKYFRRPYQGYFDKFNKGDAVIVSGKVGLYRGKIQFNHPEVHHFKDGEVQTDELVPVYVESDGVKPTKMRRIIQIALNELKSSCKKNSSRSSSENSLRPSNSHSNSYQQEQVFQEYLPEEVLKKYGLLTKKQAIYQIHNPPHDQIELFLKFKSEAQKRIIFDEFFWLELHLAQKKSGLQKQNGPQMPEDNPQLKEFLKNLSFNLTKAQQRTYKEIQADLKSPHPMHRLIQGDVGCGKTVVAFMAALHAIGNGFQVAFMVPTEILAEQHYKNAIKYLKPLGIDTRLLTGQMKLSEQQKIHGELMSGHLRFCIGTHALIQNSVDFKNLGLVIIDEQHRFGVEQRQFLRQKGDTSYSQVQKTQVEQKQIQPHFLVMTATPIPRTLAMTAYGDLEISSIDELPEGRSPVITRKVFESKRPKVIQFLKEQIKKGRQAYFVYPLVEESEKLNLKDAKSAHAKIQEELSEFQVGLLHGKMKPAEKDKIMTDFRDKKLDILVATTVIEVGVDVSNANLMIIEHTERFGLSQLHQLRGRVGRGDHKSYCVLLMGYAVSEEAQQRADIMVSTTDGFKISEADLEIRGPGEFLGKKQSGLSGFKMAHLLRDQEILKQARQAAFGIIQKDPGLKKQENSFLSQQLKNRTVHLVG